MNKRQFLLQACMMTAVSVLLRFAGVSAQVYISRRIGAEAVGVSSLINGVSGFAVTLAISGVQLGTTRLVSESIGKSDRVLFQKSLRCSQAYSLCFGFLSCLLLFGFSNIIGQHWLHDMRTAAPLRVIAMSLPCIALSSCFCGYFVAAKRAWISASVQVLEELIRIAATVALLDQMTSGGLESALMALAYSGWIADVFSMVALGICYCFDRKRCLRTLLPSTTRSSASDWTVTRRLLSITIPVAISAYVRSGLITWEHLLIPIGLQKYGQSMSASLAAYGSLHSMAMPVVLLPCALLSSFAGLIIPELTESHVRGEGTRIHHIMQKGVCYALLFSVGVAGIILCFSYELGMLLYHSEQAAEYIRLMAPLIPVMYLDNTIDAMLKGMGEQLYSMKVNIFDSSLSVILVWLLLPRLGIFGYVITIYVTEMLNAALSIVRLLNISNIRPNLRAWVLQPLLCALIATCIVRLLSGVLPAFSTSPIDVGRLILHVALSIIIYVLSLWLLGSIQRQDVKWLYSFFIKQRQEQV